MLKKISILIIPTLLLIYSCGSQKNIVSLESKITAAYEAQNYDLVLQSFEQLENSKKAIEPTIKTIQMAGLSAFKTGHWDKAHIYLSRIADTSSDPEVLGILGTNYQNSGEKELEYQHWNKYIPQLENTTYYNTATTRLFILETEKENYKKAQELWEKIPEKTDADLRFKYLKVLDELDLDAQALKYSQEILKENATHESTISWRARYYYEKAEKLYQSEMNKYNRNPDYTSYAYLRRELKKVSADFRIARDLFIKLHKMKAENKTYIQYLKNCYIRLEMKAEAAKMEKLLNEPLKK